MNNDNLFNRPKAQQIDKLESTTIDIRNKMNAKKANKTVEELSIRQTFLIDRELLERFNKIANKQPRGFKTEVINSILKSFVDEWENTK